MKTREEIEAMSDEDRQLATAKLNDFYILQDDSCPCAFTLRHGRETTFYPWRGSAGHAAQDAPDYLNSLDAMVLATCALNGAQHRAYRDALKQIHAVDTAGTPSDYERAFLDASARDRNTAFLMTLL